MEQHLFFMLVGLGLGGLYALLGVGIVLHYRGTGVINFALAMLASYSVFVVDEVRDTGDVVFPVLFIPDRFNIGDDISMPVAFIIGLLFAVGIGLIADRLVFRQLAERSTLAQVVASIGLLVGFQRLIDLKFGFETRSSDKVLPTEPFTFIEGVTVPRDRLWFAVMVIVLALAIAAFLRFTKTGLAVQAASENPLAASFARWSPRRLATVTIVGAQVLVALGLLFGSPIRGNLNSIDFIFLVVPGLAAALVGRLTSLTATVTAGLVIGMIGSWFTLLSGRDWFPDFLSDGAEDALVFGVIAASLFILGRGIPSRGDVGEAALPSVILPKNRPPVIIACTVVVVAALALTSGSIRFGIVTSLAFILITSSLVVLVGFAGQISLAQAGFAGAAGFFLTNLGGALAYPITLILAAIGATILGVIVGIPALRIRGAQLAVVTIGAGLAMETLIFRSDGTLEPVPQPGIFGLDLSVQSGRDIARLPFALAVAFTVIVVMVLLGNVLRGRTGRRFLAVRSNERAAASIGLSVANTKLTAFALSSFLAGLGGGLITYSRTQISAESFGVLAGLAILLFAYLGGITSIPGAVIAAVLAPLGLFFVVLEQIVQLGEFYVLLAGFGAVIQTILAPEGVAGDIAEKHHKRKTPSVDHALSSQQVRYPPTVPGFSSTSESPALSTGAPNEDGTVEGVGEVRLVVREITVRFGGLVAVGGVSLEAKAGEVLGLIGPNGAGKTTFIDAVTGFVQSSGEVVLQGESIHGDSAHEIVRKGLTRTWQSMELFEDMDVRSNLLVAGERASWRELFVDSVRPGSDTDEADAILSQLGLLDSATRSPSELSLGQRKLVGIGRALMSEPQVLLLDEPAAGLDSTESRELGRRLRAIADSGIAVILIDHDMGLILDISDQLAVIDTGIRIAYGPPNIVRNDPAVIEAYLGSGGSDDAEVVSPAEQDAETEAPPKGVST